MNIDNNCFLTLSSKVLVTTGKDYEYSDSSSVITRLVIPVNSFTSTAIDVVFVLRIEL